MGNLNLELLIKLMGLSTSSNDPEALLAVRKANEHLARMKWTWEALLHGKVKIAADPFNSIPNPNAATQYQAPRPPPVYRPRQPRPPKQPKPKKPTFTLDDLGL